MSSAQARTCSSSNTLYALLEQSAARNPDAIAIEAPDQKPLTYRGLMEQCRMVATFLQGSGIGRNDRVAIVLPNGPEMAAAFLSFAGCVTTAPLNPGYRQAEFDFYLADLNAHALVVQAGIDSPAIAAARERRVPILTLSPTSSAEAGRFVLTGELHGTPTTGEEAQPDDIALVLHTSGTTSRPKIVPLTQANLCHSARTIAATLALSPADRCLNVMPLFHIHGLIAAVLSSLAAGGSAVCTPGFYAPRFFAWLEQFSPTWYTAVPTMHQAILERAGDHTDTVHRNPLRFVRSASSALPPQVMAELEAVFQAPALEAYGMTEGSHQIASNPLPPAARKPGSVGLAAGPEVAVMDAEGNLLSACATGEIVVRGDSVTCGYENNPDANASAFAHGWFRTGDQGYIDAEGYIFLTGRIKEIINRGGEKIAPREIEEVLLDHPAVTQAVAFAVPHYRLGETVGAAVILCEVNAASPEALRLFLSDRLADYKLPETLLFLEEFPKGATGKLQRIGMAARLGVEPIDDGIPTERPDYMPPRTADERLLTEIWEDVLGLSRIGIHDQFFHLGGDSMLATRLLSRLRDSLQVEIRFVEFFAHPTVAGLADLIDKRSKAVTAVLPLCPTQRDGDLRLSFAQERLWFLDQLDPGESAYNQIFALRLHGILDITALNRALTTITGRHESLRTTFTALDGTPTQVILPAVPQSLDRLDLCSLPSDEREEQARFIAVAFARQHYDLACGPLWRTQLLCLQPQDHLLVIGMHHIISDGWSRGVLRDEIFTLYAAFHADEPSPLAPLPLQYPDYALWQHQWLSGETLQVQRAYWMEQLADLPTLDLPTDHARPPLPTYQGGLCLLPLDEQQTQQLKQLSRQEGVTLYMTVLAAFSTLLSRYSGQEDIAVGSPIANRNRAEIEDLIGYFANTLVLRTDLSGDPSFQTLLGRVRERTLEAYTYQDFPFEALVEALHPQRYRDRNPLFQVMLVQHNPAMEGVVSGGLRFSDAEVFSGVAPFDLTLIFRETASGGMEFRFEYSVDLFELSTVERLAGHFQTLLEGIVSDPMQKLSRLPVLTEAEYRQVLLDWNASAAEYPRDQCVHELFEEQAERTPNALALTFEGQSLTYRQLNARANQLARHLHTLGVGPEVVVGLCVERSLEMVVGLLGILKAGGAYLPLDPSHPLERLLNVLKTTAPVVVTHRGLEENFCGYGGRIFCLERDEKELAEQCQQNPVRPADPENLAYIIHTSGSTGTPRGVMVTHRSLINAYHAWVAEYDLRASVSSHLQMANFTFDVFTGDWVRALCSGARLVLCPRDYLLDPVQLYRLMLRESVDIAEFVPAVMRSLMEYLDKSGQHLDFMRLITVGSDHWYNDEHERLRKLCGAKTRVVNTYGLTEATIDSTCFEHTALELPEEGSAPIGRSFPNSTVYVLDRHLEPVPVGVARELYIGGEGVARGYLGSPELTAAKFVPDPFSGRPGARLYRTGDLGRYLPDGNLEFVARLDSQVKVRGFRIELGEIESVLLQHPDVREAVVLAREDTRGEKQLAAYVVGRDGALSVGELREHVRNRLPGYMVPSAFAMLDALPLTYNGKVDRNALSKAQFGRQEKENGYVEARTEGEVILAGIWGEILGLDRVSVRDSFFDLGGHSLLAARLFAQIEQRLGRKLPLALLFETPTIAHLAAQLGDEPSRRLWSSLVAIQPHGEEPPFFCVHGIGANLLNYRLLAGHLGACQPFYGLQSRGLDGNEPAHTDVEAMAADYIAEMRAVQPVGPYRLGGGSAGGVIAFEMAQQLRSQSENVALLALIDTRLPTEAVSIRSQSRLERLLRGADTHVGRLLLRERSTYGAYAKRWGAEKLRSLWRSRRHGAHGEVDRSLPAAVRQVTEANRAALCAYVPQPYEGRITQLLTRKTPDRTQEDSRLEWSELATEGLEVHYIAGDHDTMLEDPHVVDLAAKLRSCLERARIG